MNKKFTFIIIDCQEDFVNPTGPMAVPNALDALDAILRFMELQCDVISDIIFTVDNHPIDHCSFKKNGGPWPDHCVANTPGQQICNVLISTAKRLRIPFKIIKKGEYKNPEEYTAFHMSEIVDDQLIMKSKSDFALSKSNDFVFAGVAGDYCVLESIEDLAKVIGYEHITVLSDGVKSIDDGSTFENFIIKNNIKTI